jgi:hypothetical protein
VAPEAKIADGVKVAWFVAALYVTTPATAVAPGPVTTTVAPVIVAGFIASLKFAVITALGHAVFDPLSGPIVNTVGAVVPLMLGVQHPTAMKRMEAPKSRLVRIPMKLFEERISALAITLGLVVSGR